MPCLIFSFFDKMKSFTLYLRDEHLDALRERSQATGIPVANFIRQGIDLVLSGGVSCSFSVSGHVVSGQALLITARGA